MPKGLNDNTPAFFEIIQAGLWEKEGRLASFEKVDFQELYRLAEEQAVFGLVAAGLEHIVDVKAPKEIVLQFVGQALQLEQRNKAMNQFIGFLVDKMRHEDIYTLLVKGQGVAQCYERPIWRAAGDIDFYLSESNYEKAKALLAPLAHNVETEDKKCLHLGMTIDSWVVELHGSLHNKISSRMNKISDEVHHDIFYNGNVRRWNNNGVTVFLPDANNDVIIIFNHFINHFYGEGIGLRQICDWCRLLWKYRSDINVTLLQKRLKRMGLMKEWKSFGAFSVEYLGMPAEAMPFYENRSKYNKKAQKLAGLIIETGNFGSNKDNSYRNASSEFAYNTLTFWRRFKEFLNIATIFPLNSSKFFSHYLCNRVMSVIWKW
jgi:hypothetical protein